MLLAGWHLVLPQNVFAVILSAHSCTLLWFASQCASCCRSADVITARVWSWAAPAPHTFLGEMLASGPWEGGRKFVMISTCY